MKCGDIPLDFTFSLFFSSPLAPLGGTPNGGTAVLEGGVRTLEDTMVVLVRPLLTQPPFLSYQYTQGIHYSTAPLQPFNTGMVPPPNPMQWGAGGPFSGTQGIPRFSNPFFPHWLLTSGLQGSRDLLCHGNQQFLPGCIPSGLLCHTKD